MKYIYSLLFLAASLTGYSQCNISAVTATSTSTCAGVSAGTITLSNLPVTSAGGVGTLYDCNGTISGTIATQTSGNLVVSAGQVIIVNTASTYTSVSIDGGTLIAKAAVTTNTLTITGKGSIYSCSSITVNTSSNIGSGSRAVVGYGSISLLGNTVSQGLLYNIFGTYTVRYGTDASTTYIPVGSLMGADGVIRTYDANNIPDWGNTAPCTVSWSGTSQAGASITNLPAGNYTATINCGPGCSGTKIVTVGTKASPVISYTKQDAVNNANGSITATITGGTSYTYAWTSTTDANFSSTSQNLTGLQAGIYKLVVTETASGCQATSPLITIGNTTVCDYSALTANITAACAGQNNGAITLSGLGFGGNTSGYGAYYKCTDGTNLGTVSGNLTVTAGQVVRITSGNITTLTINGGAVIICGSAAIQNLVISNGGSFNVGSGSAVIYHPFDIPAGCIVATQEGSLTVNAIDAATNTFKDLNVYGTLLLVNGALSSTAVKLNVYGRLVNYTEINCQLLSVKSGGVFDNYGQWAEPTGPSNTFFQHEILAGGTLNFYSTYGMQVHQLLVNGVVNAKPTANTCLQVLDNLTGTGRIQKETGAQLSLCYNKALASSLVLGPGITQNLSTCACTFPATTYNNNNTAAIYGSGTSSTGCTVSWSGTSQTGASISGLAPGDYTATIVCGTCSTTRIYTVPSKAIPTVTLTPASAQICQGAVAGVQLQAGGADTYTWTPATGLDNAAIANPVAKPAVTTTYTVTGYTANSGCSAAKTVTITVNPLPVIAYTVTNSTTGNDGAITTTITAGSGSYTYLWTGPKSYTSTVGSPAGLIPGSYQVTVTDHVTGCQAAATILVGGCAWDYTIETVQPACGLTANSGSITIKGIETSATAGYGKLYKCTDGRELSNVTGDLTVGAGDVVRITSGNIGTLTIDGGAVLVCGSASIMNLVLKNGASFNAAFGSVVVYRPFDIPAGCIVATQEGSMSLYSQDAGNIFQEMNVYGTLMLINGAMHSTATKINIYGHLVNYTEIDFHYFSIKNGGVFDNYGEWVEAPNNPFFTHEVLAGGIVNLYSVYGMQLHQLLLNGTINAKAGTNTCIQILDNLSGSGKIMAEAGAQLSLCYNKILPATITLGAGVTQNTGTCACTFPDRTLNNNDAAAIYGTSNAGCSITWTGTAQTGASITGLSAGTYTATIKCGSCTKQETIILLPAAGILTLTQGAVTNSANSPCTGSATVIVTGGAGTPTLSWAGFPGVTAATLNNLCPGDYFVVAEDDAKCRKELHVKILNTTTGCTDFTVELEGRNASCPGATDGKLFAKVSGGVLKFNYAWSKTPADPPTLGQGEYKTTLFDAQANTGGYTVTVTDANNCIAVATGDVGVDKNVCPDKTGSCKEIIVDYNTPHQFKLTCACTTGKYKISSKDGNTYVLNQYYNLPAANTELKLICEDGTGITVIITGKKDPLDVVITSNKNSQCNAQNGSASFNIIGGTNTSYQLTDKSNNTQTTVTGQSFTISSLSVGTHVYELKDLTRNISKVFSFTTDKTVITLSATVSNTIVDAASSITLTSSTTNDGPYNITTDIAGVGPFTSANGIYTVIVASYPQILQNTGTYVNFTITDKNGCNASQKVTTVKKCTPSATDTEPVVNITAPSCKGNDGIITVVSPAGVTGTLTNGNQSFNSATSWTNLSAGAYDLTLLKTENGKQCIAAQLSGSKALQVPQGVVFKAAIVPVNGVDNSYTVTTQNGTPQITYVWSQGPTTIPVTLAAGASYSVKVTDQKGCIDYASIALTKPDCEGILNITYQPLLCSKGNTGSITASFSKSPATYQWSGGTLTGTVNTPAITQLGAGDYLLKITLPSNPGCETKATWRLEAPAEMAVSKNDISGSSVLLEVVNGKSPYTVKVNNVLNPNENKLLLTGLVGPKTPYHIEITDANNCVQTYDFTFEPCKLGNIHAVVVLDNNNASAEVIGGRMPYSYDWRYLQSAIKNTADIAKTVQPNYGVGTHNLIVTDFNGCVSIAEFTVSPNGGTSNCNLQVAAAGVVKVNPTAANNCDGSVSNIVVTGSYAYAYWNGVLQSPTPASPLSNKYLCGGGNYKYVLRLETAKGCAVENTFTVDPTTTVDKTKCNSPIMITGGGPYTKGCFDAPAPVDDIIVTGGSGFLYYEWKYTAPGGTTAVSTTVSDKSGLTSAKVGTYTLRVYDESICKNENTKTFTVSGPENWVIDNDARELKDNNCGFKDLIVKAVSPAFTSSQLYKIGLTTPIPPATTGVRTETLIPSNAYTNLTAGSYRLVLGKGACFQEETFTVNPYKPFAGGLFATQDSICPEQVVNLVAMPVTDYTIHWNSPVTTTSNTATIYSAGTYSVVYSYTPASGTNTCGYQPVTFTINIYNSLRCGGKSPFCDHEAIAPFFTPVVDKSCVTQQEEAAIAYGGYQYALYLAQKKKDFRQKFAEKLMADANLNESLTMSYKDQEQQYTLYYYDQAGNLVRTVPPNGVKPLDPARTATAVSGLRNGTQSEFTGHTMPTNYQYNSLNQLVSQQLPDHVSKTLVPHAGVTLPAAGTFQALNYQNTNSGLLLKTDNNYAVLYNTNDGGANWGSNAVLAPQELQDLQIVSGGTSMAVGSGGRLLVSTDNGANWFARAITNTNPDFLKVKISGGTAAVLDTKGKMYTSNDNGISWNVAGNGIAGTFSSFNLTGSTWYGVDKGNNKLYSSVNGSSWTEENVFTVNGGFTATGFDAAGNLYATGQAGAIFRYDLATGNFEPYRHNLAVNAASLNMLTQTALSANGDAYKPFSTTIDKQNGINWISTGSILFGKTEYISTNTYLAIDKANTLKYYINGTGAGTTSAKGVFVTSSTFYASTPIVTLTASALELRNTGGNVVSTLTILSQPSVTSYTDGFTIGTNMYLLGSDNIVYKAVVASGTQINITATAISNVSAVFKSNNNIYVKQGNNISQVGSGEVLTFIKDVPAGATGVSVASVGTSSKIAYTNAGNLHYWTGTELKLLNTVTRAAVSEVTSSGALAVVVAANTEIYVKGSSSWEYRPVSDGSNYAPRAFDKAALVNATTTTLYTNAGSALFTANIDNQPAVLAASTTITPNGTVTGIANDNGIKVWTATALYNGTTTTGLTANYHAIHTGLMAGTDNKILNTSSTPPAQTKTGFGILNTMQTAGGTTILAGQKGLIAKAEGSGTSIYLKPIYTGTDKDFTTLNRKGSLIWAGGSSQTISFYDGNSWTTSTLTGVIGTINAIASQGTKTWLICGKTLMSANANDNFTVASQLGSEGRGLAFNGRNEGLLVGDNGMLGKISEQGFLNFLSIDPTPGDEKGTGVPSQNLNTVQYTDLVTAYVTGANGTAIKTIDGGDHWKPFNGGQGGTGVPVIAFSDPLAGQATLVNPDGTADNFADGSDKVSSRFWYDELGRLVLSQTAKQFNIEKYLRPEEIPAGSGKVQAYTYTLYEPTAGRITETGELITRDGLPATGKYSSQIPYGTLKSYVTGHNRREITRTYYDVAEFSAMPQENLRTRVSSVARYERSTQSQYVSATHYSYDIHGNVKQLLQQVGPLNKYLSYDYDLLSGKVNKLTYQGGGTDELVHSYTYDSDNRITSVQTQRPGQPAVTDATYAYYAHGPLARKGVGKETENFAYTLQGWIKGVSGQNFSYALGYNEKDYAPIGSSTILPTPIAIDQSSQSTGLYNGDVATWTSLNPKLDVSPWTQQFRYDQLNRLTASSTLGSGAYKTSYMYDPNGNITHLERYDGAATPTLIDKLDYRYENVVNGYKVNTNKLRAVRESAGVSGIGTDIEDQADPENYKYDEDGNLTADVSENITEIRWNSYGKLTDIIRAPGSGKADLHFDYDAGGHRAAKTLTDASGSTTTYYIRDASGNVLAIYNGVILNELNLYGSARLGNLTGTQRNYELTDHLENVRTVISDKNVGVGLIDVVSAMDLYPYGQVARAYSPTAYRYGFNTQEKVDEIASGHYTAQFWEYDARTGRRWNEDPEADEVPGFSPYSCLGNSPIVHEDADGDIWHIVAGAAIGGLIGGGLEAAVQVYKHGAVTNWKAVGGAAVQGAVTGGVAAATGGASLAVSATAKVAIVGGSAIVANVAGGAANRTIQGKKTTAKDVAVDAIVGAGGAALGHVAGKVVTKVLEKSSKVVTNQVKGKVGEVLTQAKYLKQGYVSTGKAPVQAVSKVRLNGQPRVAQYDHSMKSILPGKPALTVESKFNSAGLNSLQRNARANVLTEGGLILDKTTNAQAGRAANALINGATGTPAAQTNTK